jgi:hypothetical protein
MATAICMNMMSTYELQARYLSSNVVSCRLGSSGYKDGVRHWLRSSTEVAECVFVPGNVNDLAAIVSIFDRSVSTKYVVEISLDQDYRKI